MCVVLVGVGASEGQMVNHCCGAAALLRTRVGRCSRSNLSSGLRFTVLTNHTTCISQSLSNNCKTHWPEKERDSVFWTVFTPVLC